VNFDENSYVDDYAYLASIPTTVFYDKDAGRLFSYPLLYYQDPYPVKEDKEKSLNARQGIDYFMEDWMSYCNGRLDGMTLINVDKDKVKQWPSREVTEIKGDDPYSIAAEIALNDWSYSDKAVVAVVDSDFVKEINKTEGKITGTFSIDKRVKSEHFEVPQTNKLNPQFREFTVPDGYTCIQARVWYSCLYLAVSFPRFGIGDIINVSLPAGDKDFQLYCKYNDDWMQVAAIDAWNAKQGMDKDKAIAYVYKPGPWRIAITDVPTKKIVGHYGTWKDIILNSVKGVVYKVDIKMYPGVEIPLTVSPPYCCRDVEIQFKCDKNANFEYLLVGPSGEKIAQSKNGTIKVSKLGECLPGENYRLIVYSPEDVSGSFGYELSYSWHQNMTRAEGDSLSSATEGAVLASVLNAPILYTSSNKLPEVTKNVLNKLGVKHIYLVNLGGHLKDKVLDEIKGLAKTDDISDYSSIYNNIRKISGYNNDVVFSTVDPWTSWYVAELKPSKEKKGALHLGPAAYIAAHHGTPVLIIDNHPELSSAVVWHTEFWRNHPNGYTTPTVSEMFLTGRRVYDFLEKHGFDKKGMESIVTVAGQFDIGASWDRVFVGKAISGRFSFSPIDSAYWIARDVFYPALIFENPAMDPNGIMLENGSKSKRGPFGRLIIIRPSRKETYKYPVLESFMPVYIHRFNERASKYWGFVYQCADGIIPGVTNSNNPIDDGTNLLYKNEAGSFWPDISESDYVPFYMKRCGYSNVFSTNFEVTMKNLNTGCLIWVVGTHGNSYNGGELKFPNPNSIFYNKKEPNPWRGYEWYLGSTEEPDTMTTEIHGIIPMLLGNPNWNGIIRTAIDLAPAKRPLLDIIGNVLSVTPVLKYLAPDWLKDTQDYYDGIVGSSLFSTLGTVARNGIEIDDSIDNIHCCGFITAACLPAYKYLHVAMVRHGSSFQIIDPWGTSWYSSFWEATIPRDIALGNTVGEAYTKGMAHVGILYLGGGGFNGEKPQWWWDKAENVCLFGDPNLRVYVPSTEYSDANHWEKKDVQPLSYDNNAYVDGHMLYGATSHPH
ncbi:MAG: hypothetical protein J7K13_01010, partial [Thermoplasmata archaeon]|nr:hypothetical protein [Thermoplasmata archaeon]